MLPAASLYEFGKLRLCQRNPFGETRDGKFLLGEREVRRWVRLVATLAAGSGKSSQLVSAALVRGRFCESLSSKIQHDGSDLFLLGLFSLMDAILEMPMADSVSQRPGRS